MVDTQTEIPTEPAPTSEKGLSLGRFLIDLLETLVLSVLLFIAINAVSARIRVDGFSMEPTLESGEFVVVNKLAYRLSEPARGDIVVFRYPYDPQQEYIKRIIGLPGDTIEIANGVVSVNGESLEEPYIAAAPAYQTTLTIPEGSVFVLGDNRNNSSDSHNWGALPVEYLVGKALIIYWPPTQWGLVAHASAASAAR